MWVVALPSPTACAGLFGGDWDDIKILGVDVQSSRSSNVCFPLGAYPIDRPQPREPDQDAFHCLLPHLIPYDRYLHFTADKPSQLVLSGLLALLVTTTTAQEVTDLCTVSPPRCTIGATACPSGCFKSDRCTRPCPSKTTTVVTYTSRTTVRSITTSTSTTTTTRTRTRTRTTTVTATPSAAPPATCAAQVPYINVFTFVERSCAVLVDAERDLLCLFDDAPQVNFTFAGPPNKLNTPTWRTLPSGTQYPTSECVELAVPGSRSAYFTVDGASRLLS